jgi:3-dehydroquinate dehydratase/shikimate dehydrogenase
MGEAGKWTRILGLAHGAFMTYASIETGSETAPGQISAEDLRSIYRVKEISRETDVYGIIAGDTSYSMSPHIHNPAFASTGADAVFIPLQVAALDEFMRRMVLAGSREVELNFKGFSVTNPHKQAIRKFLSWTHPDAAAIGAINTVKIVGEELHGYNTDAGGFIKPLLREFGDLNESRAAVIGTGGAARACIYVLKTHGCDVTVFGRDGAKVETLAREFGARHASLSGSTFGDFDIVVNATPVGTKGPKQHETVATANELLGARVVYDLTYNPVDTVLAAEARSAGATFIGGLEMLINQGAEQFKIWTGLDGPLDVMRSAARKRLGL